MSGCVCILPCPGAYNAVKTYGHKGLLHKLKSICIDEKLLKWFESYRLTTRRQQDVINEKISDTSLTNERKYSLWLIAYNATLNNISVISWRSVLVLLVEEIGVPGENHRPTESH